MPSIAAVPNVQVSTPFTPHYTTKYPDIDRGMNYSILLDNMDKFFPNAFNCCCSEDVQVSTPFTPHYTTKYPDIDRGMNYSILLDNMDKFFPNAFNCCCSEDVQVSTPFTLILIEE